VTETAQILDTCQRICAPRYRGDPIRCHHSSLQVGKPPDLQPGRHRIPLASEERWAALEEALEGRPQALRGVANCHGWGRSECRFAPWARGEESSRGEPRRPTAFRKEPSSGHTSSLSSRRRAELNPKGCVDNPAWSDARRGRDDGSNRVRGSSPIATSAWRAAPRGSARGGTRGGGDVEGSSVLVKADRGGGGRTHPGSRLPRSLPALSSWHLSLERGPGGAASPRRDRSPSPQGRAATCGFLSQPRASRHRQAPPALARRLLIVTGEARSAEQ
jgi:hypothetical protein